MSVTGPVWLGTGTDGIQTFKLSTETANHAATTRREPTEAVLPVKPVLTRQRRLAEISVCFSSLDTRLR